MFVYIQALNQDCVTLVRNRTNHTCALGLLNCANFFIIDNKSPINPTR